MNRAGPPRRPNRGGPTGDVYFRALMPDRASASRLPSLLTAGRPAAPSPPLVPLASASPAAGHGPLEDPPRCVHIAIRRFATPAALELPLVKRQVAAVAVAAGGARLA